MQFSLEKEVEFYAIHSWTEGGAWLTAPLKTTAESGSLPPMEPFLQEGSFLLMSDSLHDWDCRAVEQIRLDDVKTWVSLRPEIVILGTGNKHVWPEMDILGPLYTQGIGVEIMRSDAACRTYNLLMSDRRRVLAAILVD
ncbi:MAG: hypothetical protein D6698_12615 [Gammaproteobacteria bacterium]|nr:MAG: hypothetical protein D6698_12615 [Gammaproteobacteria bacterium]